MIRLLIALGILAAVGARADTLLQYRAPKARVVYLAGDFNDWANNAAGKVSDPAFAMTRGTNGVWQKSVALEPGTYRFKFVVNGDRWITPPGFVDLDGDSNAVFRVRPTGEVTQTNFFWGLGERFEAWNLSGRVIESWARDMAQGGMRSSYFAVPFVISSGGKGWYVPEPGKVTFDLRDGMRVDSTNVVHFTGTPREISQQYTKLVGRPVMPPEWVFQPWISRNSYLSAYDVDRVLEKMDAHGLKVGVVVLEAWAHSLQDFQFETNRYPRTTEWMAKLQSNDVHVVLWETPSIWTSASTYEVAKSNGWLVLNEDGSEYVTDWLENGRKIDFRKPAARAWWTELHRPLVAMGVDGFKTDGGERHPDPQFHNQLPYYYQRAALDAFPSNGVTFARSANALCAGNSLFWAGDQHADWGSLRRVVRAGLSAALCGFSFWGHDIGGYTGTPTKQLYIRWMQLGAFSPIMQFHGITPREPYYFDDETVQISKFYFDLRWALQDYLIATAKQDAPMWRPLIWEWPDDLRARACDDEFMLGDDLLVAPILDEFKDRQVYLPAGEWVAAWTQEKITGPTNLVVKVALREIPVFARNGRLLPAQAGTLAPPEKRIERRIWRGQKYEKIFLSGDVTLDVPAEFEVLPNRTQRGERLAFYVMWPKDVAVGTYSIGHGVELVKLPFPGGEFYDLGKTNEATTTFTSARGGEARLYLGSGDGMTVWLNGKQVFEKIVHRSAEPDEDVVEVELDKGLNEVRVKVTHPPAGIGPNGFYFRIAAGSR